MDLQKQVKKKNNSTPLDGGGGAVGDIWEKFLPKMVMRVLLVESDDSTRQIISALLRKCSYKVAAVGDGLKAWEILKEKPDSIDLILTEVELPSISGYALLTLIMEHDVCKNIPIIMMSAKDSISTVYKCMLRGAADFLVKPVRKNELKNLWQHVWRKQASSNSAGLGPPDESIAQQKVEATAENNALSNHSSDYMACIQRNRECIEKGSDAQSSCTKPELEIEGAKCHSNETNTQAFDNDAKESRAATITENQNVETYCIVESSSREAIDLIGALDKKHKSSFGNFVSNVSTNRFDILPVLDLSLRRSYPTSSVNEEGDMLNHSNASAFSWYTNKPLILPGASNHHNDHETNIEKQFSSHTPDRNSDYPQQREITHPIPITGVRFENEVNAYISLVSPTNYTQLDHQPSSYLQLQNLMDQRVGNAIGPTDNKQGMKLEHLEDQRLSFCNGNSNDKINAISECGDEEFIVHEGSSHRSTQREAALMKFRMKRKDRCFDKKVRYESRKKLAERRPRVKGQFVRQGPNDCIPENSSAS